jgi:hypothetical protein
VIGAGGARVGPTPAVARRWMGGGSRAAGRSVVRGGRLAGRGGARAVGAEGGLVAAELEEEALVGASDGVGRLHDAQRVR